MKALLLIVALSMPSWATWTLTQVASNNACTNITTCAVTVTSTGAGHLLVFGLIATVASTTISSVTSGACSVAWAHPAGTNGTGTGSVDLFYCTNSVTAQTSITVTANQAMGNNSIAVVWEANSTLGSIAIDSGATPAGLSPTATCTACAGKALTLSGNNNFIAGVANCGGTCSAVTGTGFTNDLTNPLGDGVMHGITSGSVTAPATWTQTSGVMLANAAAFTEASGGAAAAIGVDKRRKLQKLGVL